MDATWVIVVLCMFLLITVIFNAVTIWVVTHSQRMMEELQRQHNDLVSIQISQSKTETQKGEYCVDTID